MKNVSHHWNGRDRQIRISNQQAQLKMEKVVAIIFVLLSCVELSIHHLQQLPTLENESEVQKFLDEIISIFETKLSFATVPEYAKEDGRDIINELKDELLDCRKTLLRTHSLVEFRGCVHQQIEDAEDQIWGFKQSLQEESSSSFLSLHAVIIPFMLMLICKVF